MLAQSQPIIENVRKVLAFHRVTVMDFNAVCGKAGKYCVWAPLSNTVHPGWATHQRFADAMAFAMKDQINRFRCEDSFAKSTFYSSSLLDQLSTCMHPTTEFNAYTEFPNSVQKLPLTGSWDLTEDRPNKPGWIATKVGATKVFMVTFGSAPTLSVSYMRSYDSFGSAVITLNEVSVTLDGHWSDRVSLVQTQWFQASIKNKRYEQVSLGEIGAGAAFNAQPFSEYEVKIEFVGSESIKNSKFKLISVVAC